MPHFELFRLALSICRPPAIFLGFIFLVCDSLLVVKHMILGRQQTDECARAALLLEMTYFNKVC
jgi:hypothetical protein